MIISSADMLKDIKFLLNQLHVIEHMQDTVAIKAIQKKYKIKLDHEL